MVVDTSAIVAVIRREADFESYLRAITAADESYISAVNLLECHIVLSTQTESLNRLLLDAEIEVREFSSAMVSLARLAFLQYGKGRHRAGLNICDCAAYATSKQCGLPLLFKGSDFIHTDVEAVKL